MNANDLALAIDQTMLKPTVGPVAGSEWITSNKYYGFATLCVSPFLVPTAAEVLAGGDTRVCSVAGFPLGYSATAAKAVEARRLVEEGCAEVDMVVNVGALLEGQDAYVLADIAAVVSVVEEAGRGNALVKVILETCYLEESDIVLGCRLAEKAGAAFVKTSTGFGPRGASVRDVELMRATVSSGIGVKAAGGIRDLDAALAMLAAGATRIGTSGRCRDTRRGDLSGDLTAWPCSGCAWSPDAEGRAEVASYQATALVCRKTKLGETDTIVTLLASDGRQLRAVAKGLRKPGGRFGARLEPFAVVDLLLHEGRNLDIVTEARTVSTHSALREDFDRSAAAMVVVDLLDKVAVEGQAEPQLFAMATTTLDVMETASLESLPALVVAFLAKAMAMHGYRPQLESCACCAGELHSSKGFSVASGGAVCPECGGLDASAVGFSPEGRAWLERLMQARMAEIPALDMPPAAVADCFALIRSFVSYHLPARLKALDYYAGMVPRG